MPRCLVRAACEGAEFGKGLPERSNQASQGFPQKRQVELRFGGQLSKPAAEIRPRGGSERRGFIEAPRQELAPPLVAAVGVAVAIEVLRRQAAGCQKGQECGDRALHLPLLLLEARIPRSGKLEECLQVRQLHQQRLLQPRDPVRPPVPEQRRQPEHRVAGHLAAPFQLLARLARREKGGHPGGGDDPHDDAGDPAEGDLLDARGVHEAAHHDDGTGAGSHQEGVRAEAVEKVPDPDAACRPHGEGKGEQQRGVGEKEQQQGGQGAEDRADQAVEALLEQEPARRLDHDQRGHRSPVGVLDPEELRSTQSGQCSQRTAQGSNQFFVVRGNHGFALERVSCNLLSSRSTKLHTSSISSPLN